MANKVLVTGGTGAVGRELCTFLFDKGYEVRILSRSADKNSRYPTFQWDYQRALIDKKAFENCDFIIHLAGAGIADKKWTKKRKQEIIDSRVKTTAFLYKALSTTKNNVKGIIAASAVGYYGQHTTAHNYKEDDPAGNDFVAEVCKAWEKEVNRFQQLDMRSVNLRFGIVLMQQGGALEKMALPFKWHAGAAIGSGKQFIPWIHYHDLNRIILQALEKATMQSAYNCCAPHPVDNATFTKLLGDVLHKKVFLPNIPSFVLKLFLGQRAVLLTEGSRVSSEKILDTGFEFKYPKLKPALEDLLV